MSLKMCWSGGAFGWISDLFKLRRRLTLKYYAVVSSRPLESSNANVVGNADARKQIILSAAIQSGFIHMNFRRHSRPPCRVGLLR